MKRKIRYGCFETNSSSEHAICISHRKFDKHDIEPQTIEFDHADFPRETHVYTTLQERANYLYQAIWDVYSSKYHKNKKKFIFKYTEACNHIYDVLGKYNVDCSFTENHTGTSSYDNGYSFTYERGGIDHGMELGGWVDLVLSNEKYLLKYLFNNAVIVVGSDEGIGGDFDEVLDFYKAGYDIWYKYTG